MNRKVMYAGQFYTDLPIDLNEELETYFNEQENIDSNGCFGIICPHAGYIYSGRTASKSFNYVRNNQYKQIVIIAPSHRYFINPFSVGDYEYLETPIGNLKVKRSIVTELLKDPNYSFNREADQSEHSLEVQLPFIYHLFPNTEIIPILFSQQNHQNAKYLKDKLIEVIKDDLDKTLFVISSDFSHYHSASTARTLDLKAIEMICSLKCDDFFESILRQEIEACGFGGILFIMELARELGIRQAKDLEYTHSGLVNMDNQRVVGYASIVFERS